METRGEIDGGCPPDAVEWLRLEFTRRRQRNPRYSLRAFAQQLAVKSGPLSEIINRRRPLTLLAASHLAERLCLSPEEARSFIDARRGVADTATRFRELPTDVFNLIADWYHYGILSLMETVDWRESAAWIARRLGITPTEARAAIDRMLRLGLLTRRRGKLAPARQCTTTQDVPSRALRHFHRQLLNQSLAALDLADVAERDITSITMAIDPSKISEAKRLIREFRRRLARLLESGRRTEVYHLNVQLIPAKEGGPVS